jgi:predicted GIY-YIG superfamily endonuclease
MKGYMYILRCANGMYYTGSTKDPDKRLIEHEVWDGAKFTRGKLPESFSNWVKMKDCYLCLKFLCYDYS